jgi:peptidyl-Asp metalloendopeptidase
MSRQWPWILFLGVGVAVLFGMTAISGFAADELFSDAGEAQAVALQTGGARPDPTVVRIRYVKVDFDQLRGSRFPEGAESVLLNLYGDLSYKAVRERIEKRSATRYTWFGRVDGVALSQVILVVEDGVMAGNIMVNGDFYQIRTVGEGVHSVRKIDQSKFPEEAPPIPVHTAPDQSVPLAPSSGTDDGSTIDVLVVYTAAAASSSSNIMAEIQLGIDETNQSYANSGIAQRVRLVHAAQVNYTETGRGDTDLTRLKNTSDGYLDEVHSMRDTYAADLVSFWVENMDACGIGYLMTTVSTSFAPSGFSVVKRSCATGYYSFGHEMGHNMGAHHDRYVSDGDGAYTYSHGYVYTPAKWRTVMAYDNQCTDNGYSCTRIPYWSNPDANYQQVPTGISQTASNSANNTLTLNNTAYTVANFRPSVSPTPQCDLALGFDVTISGKHIGDGYHASNFTTGTLFFDICTTAQGNTSDSFVGYLYDNQHDYWQVSGTIIWNSSSTSAYIQGANNADGSMSYIDGTIKYARGKYSMSAKGGSSDGASFIESYSSVRGSGYALPSDRSLARGESLKIRKRDIQGSGRVTQSDRVFR